jgi:hypothetical protein
MEGIDGIDGRETVGRDGDGRRDAGAPAARLSRRIPS